ncbi:hypothetical protein, partial [Neoaquamicrobium sediminum]|uniref:hypothetical protein n=1 Tax=Neoaquamicrobium sediminum TaxID=1849104 RepID=UPI0040359991
GNATRRQVVLHVNIYSQSWPCIAAPSSSTPPPSMLIDTSESVAMGGGHAGQAETEGEMSNVDASIV